MSQPHAVYYSSMSDFLWQRELQQSITNIDELFRILAIPPYSGNINYPADYPLLVPRPFANLMERGNPNDPLLLQVLPQPEENLTAYGFSKDPLNEIANTKQCFTLNKYAGRTLLLASQKCGIHCRFCFRRHFSKISNFDANTPLAPALLTSIQNDTTIEEIILSGGDPLMLDDEALDYLFQSILQIKHIRRVRIHSRLPIALPSRLTPELVKILSLPIPVYLVLHINHPNELSEAFLEQRELLLKPVVMAQTVLLRNINDDVEILYRLFRRLADTRILPYYLHQLDRVEGAAHFEVIPEKGRQMIAQLRNRLPGYALPTYVREIYGKACKEIVVG
jgi:EF-P beta-lysylation protein EpmB